MHSLDVQVGVIVTDFAIRNAMPGTYLAYRLMQS